MKEGVSFLCGKVVFLFISGLESKQDLLLKRLEICARTYSNTGTDGVADSATNSDTIVR